MNGAPTLSAWWDIALPLVIGVAGVTVLAAAFARVTHRAAWQRALWQGAVLGVLAIVAVEVCGVRSVLSRTLDAHAPLPAGSTIPRDIVSSDARETDLTLLRTAATEAAAPDTSVERQAATTRRAGEVTAGVQESYGARGIELESPPPASQGTWWPGVIWLAGACALGMRWIVAQSLLALFLRRRTRPLDGKVPERARSIAKRLGFGGSVLVRAARGIASPFAVGILRPKIVVQEEFLSDLEPIEQDAVLAHEIAHLAGRDGAWRAASEAMTALLWWHPCAWYARHRLMLASEAAADDASLVVPGGSRALAGGLVRIARRLTARAWLPIVPQASGRGLRSGLGRRVDRLLGLGDRPWRTPSRVPLRIARSLLPAVYSGIFIIVTVALSARRGEASVHAGSAVRAALSGFLGAPADSEIPTDAAAGGPRDERDKTAPKKDEPAAQTDLPRDVPAAVRDTITILARGGSLSTFERKETPVETYYRVAIDKGGARVAFVISPQGDVLQFDVVDGATGTKSRPAELDDAPATAGKSVAPPGKLHADLPLDEWTQAYGSPDHNRYRGIRDTITYPKVLWRLREQSGVPAVYRGNVYAPGPSLVRANLADGKVLATVAAGDRAQGEVGKEGNPEEKVHYQGTPVVADERVIAVKTDGAVDAWSLDLQNRHWSSKLGGESWGTFSPAAAKGVLVIANGPVVALSVADGSELWRFEAPEGRVELAPAIADGTVFFATRPGTVYALALETGAVRWKQFTDSQFGWSDPLVVGGRIFLCDRGTPSRRGALNAFEASSGKHLWTGEFGATGSSTPAVGDDHVYIGFGRYVGFYDLETGAIDRSKVFRTGVNPFGSPTIVGESLIFGNLDGFLYVFGYASGKLRWRFTPRGQAGGEGKTQVHGFAYLQPGMILVTTTEGIFAIAQDPSETTCPEGFILTPR